MDAFVEATAVDSSKGADSEEDFDHVLAAHPVRLLFFSGPILSTQCHWCWSIRYK